MATETSLSDVFPLGSRLNERGCLEVGGCDTIELAREFGTPAYVVAEDDLRSRARTFAQGCGATWHPAASFTWLWRRAFARSG
jgi:diaminopimelate decarboxylase